MDIRNTIHLSEYSYLSKCLLHICFTITSAKTGNLIIAADQKDYQLHHRQLRPPPINLDLPARKSIPMAQRWPTLRRAAHALTPPATTHPSPRLRQPTLRLDYRMSSRTSSHQGVRSCLRRACGNHAAWLEDWIGLQRSLRGIVPRQSRSGSRRGVLLRPIRRHWRQSRPKAEEWLRGLPSVVNGDGASWWYQWEGDGVFVAQ